MMAISADDIFQKIAGAAEGAFQDGWKSVSKYAPDEFHKMAVQLSRISENVALYEQDPKKGYSLETGRLLFRMQRDACESVLVALTKLTLLAVQQALNAIMNALKEAFGGVLAAFL
jgi:hypothetical protein